MLDNKIYKRGFSMPLLKCVAEPDASNILKEIHEGLCGGHTRGNSLAQKVITQGYFWLTLKTDALDYVKKCDKCQRFADVPRAPPVELTTMTSPWPFAVWGIDMIGSLPTGKGGVKYEILAINYLTEWTEVEPLASITAKKSLDFVVKNIVCRYGIPRKIVSDNGTRF